MIKLNKQRLKNETFLFEFGLQTMKNIFFLLICFLAAFSQVDSISADSILSARMDLLMNTNAELNMFHMSYEDSIRPVWKSTFRSSSGELDIYSGHSKDDRYNRNFIGIGVDPLKVGRRFFEWLGLKEPSVDENGNYLDDYQQELYVEKLWKQRVKDKISLDSVKLLLRENN